MSLSLPSGLRDPFLPTHFLCGGIFELLINLPLSHSFWVSSPFLYLLCPLVFQSFGSGLVCWLSPPHLTLFSYPSRFLSLLFTRLPLSCFSVSESLDLKPQVHLLCPCPQFGGRKKKSHPTRYVPDVHNNPVVWVEFSLLQTRTWQHARVP